MTTDWYIDSDDFIAALNPPPSVNILEQPAQYEDWTLVMDHEANGVNLTVWRETEDTYGIEQVTDDRTFTVFYNQEDVVAQVRRRIINKTEVYGPTKFSVEWINKLSEDLPPQFCIWASPHNQDTRRHGYVRFLLIHRGTNNPIGMVVYYTNGIKTVDVVEDEAIGGSIVKNLPEAQVKHELRRLVSQAWSAAYGTQNIS